MTKKIEYYEDGWSIGKGNSWLRESEGFIEGLVCTVLGLVDVYSEEDFSTLRVIYNGRCYVRSWDKTSSARSLAYHANKFIREVMEVK